LTAVIRAAPAALPRVFGAQQRLTHEEGLEARPREPLDVRPGPDAALREANGAGRNLLRHRFERAEVRLEARQVARVHPENIRRKRGRLPDLDGAVRLDDDGEAAVAGARPEPREVGRRQRAHDQQDRVRAEGHGEVELTLVDEEILHEHGQARHRPDAHEPLGITAEVVLLGHDGDRGRVPASVGEREALDLAVGIGQDLSGRRRARLELGDDPRARSAQGRHEGRSVARARSRAPRREFPRERRVSLSERIRPGRRSCRARGLLIL
jgi:hypothetical protein